MNEDDWNICDINLGSFNNKSEKGDDDFEDWMMNQAPFKEEYSISISDYTADTIDISSLTSGSTTVTFNTSTTNNIKKLAYAMPIDLLYKWFPTEMKEDELNDDIPF